MKRLVLRLFLIILSVWLAGSVCHLWATVGGHGPAPSTSPTPPPTTPPPTAPPMLDTKLQGPPASPPRDTGGGGCGGAVPPSTSQTMVAESKPPMDYSKPPAAGGVCHDFVGDRIGASPPQNGISRTAGEITGFLQNPRNGYTEGSPSGNLPEGTVVQFGGAHVGIVGPGGKIHHYTKAAPRHGIPASVNVNNSISEITNTTRTWDDGKTTQPYLNSPVRVWLPPSESKP